MKKLLFGGAFALALALVFFNCSKESTDYLANADCTGIDTQTNTYTKPIKSILDTYCATSGCHDAFARERGVDLSSYATSKSAFQTTNCLCSIHHGSECVQMPQGGAKLSDAIIQKIDCWAKNGYQE